jgi:predicted GIY-YIG superfamily endonuclease
MYFVYILKSTKDPEQHYVGLTRDIEIRLNKHNFKSYNGYSKKYAPWKIETYIAFNNKRRAEEFEHYLKAGSGHTFLKKRLI